MANARSQMQAPTSPVEEDLGSNDQGIGTLGIILIVVLLLVIFGVIGFSFNS